MKWFAALVAVAANAQNFAAPNYAECLKGTTDIDLAYQLSGPKHQNNRPTCTWQKMTSALEAAIFRDVGEHWSISAEGLMCSKNTEALPEDHEKQIKEIQSEPTAGCYGNYCDYDATIDHLQRVRVVPMDSPKTKSHFVASFDATRKSAKAGTLTYEKFMCDNKAAYDSCQRSGRLKLLPKSIDGCRFSVGNSRVKAGGDSSFGHAMLLIGTHTDAKTGRRYLVMANSWGAAQERMWIPFEESCRVYRGAALVSQKDLARIRSLQSASSSSTEASSTH